MEEGFQGRNQTAAEIFVFFPLAAVILIFAVIVLDKPEQSGNDSANESTEAVDPSAGELRVRHQSQQRKSRCRKRPYRRFMI